MKLSTAKAEIQRWGLLRFVYDAVMCRLKPWFTLCAVDTRAIIRNPNTPELAPHREVRVATPGELIAASADPVNDLNPNWIKRAHARGEMCVAVFEGDKILSYVWRAFAPSPHEKGLWVHFDPQYVYSFKAYTPPAYRQQRLQHVVVYELDTWLLDRGYHHYISFIETHNYPSLISGKKRNNQRVGYAGYLILFSRIIPFRTPGAKKHGFAFVPQEKSSVPTASGPLGKP